MLYQENVVDAAFSQLFTYDGLDRAGELPARNAQQHQDRLD